MQHRQDRAKDTLGCQRALILGDRPRVLVPLQLDRLTGSRVRISVDPPDSYQLDGDTIGLCSSMTAEIAPGALVLRVPRAIRRAIEQGASTLELAELAEHEVAVEADAPVGSGDRD